MRKHSKRDIGSSPCRENTTNHQQRHQQANLQDVNLMIKEGSLQPIGASSMTRIQTLPSNNQLTNQHSNTQEDLAFQGQARPGQTVRCGSASGLQQELKNYASGAHYQNTGQAGYNTNFASSDRASVSLPQGGQRSGKAFFTRGSVGNVDDIPSQGTNDSRLPGYKRISELLDSFWPKDPLREQAQQYYGNNEIIEIGDFLDGVSRGDLRQESQIKQSLKRINDTELKLTDMISRHIKKQGHEHFSNSNFVVTNRSNFRAQIESAKLESQGVSTSRNKHSKSLVKKQSSRRLVEVNQKSSSLNRHKGEDRGPSEHRKQIKMIMEKGKAVAEEDKIHSLYCFRPREMFNINTHVLFQKEQVKDTMDSSEESNDDEDDITQLLRDQKEYMRENPPHLQEQVTCAKIDLKAYDASKPFEYNTKVIRQMINKAKQATNTTRSASLAQQRKEQVKMSKFIKKDQSHLKESKIARQTNEAIKYLKKRQPLTVQNTQSSNDDQLFSLKSKRNTTKNLQTENRSPSPSKQSLLLQHVGEKAKFYSRVPTQVKQGSTSSARFGNQSQPSCDGLTTTDHTRGKQLGGRGRSNFKSHTPINSQGGYKQTRGSKTGSNFSPFKAESSQSTTRVSTFNKGGTTSVHPQFQRIPMRIQSGSSEVSGSNVPPRFNQGTSQNPNFINNIMVVSNQGRLKASGTRGRQKSAVTIGGQKQRQSIRQLVNVQGQMVASHDRLNLNQSDLESINFHPVIAEEGTQHSFQQREELPEQIYSSTNTINQPVKSTRFSAQEPDVSGRQPCLGQTFNENSVYLQTSNGDQQHNQRFLRRNRMRSSYDKLGTQQDNEAEMYQINETLESKSYGPHHSQHQQAWAQSYQGVDQSGYLGASTFQTFPLLNHKKSSAVVKVDQNVLEKVPTLNLMEMMRILDARNEDMGLNKQVNTDQCTPDGLERLIMEFTDGNGQGPAQRFRDYCDQKCVNRKLVLQGFSLGPKVADEIASILAVNREICHVDLSKNNLQDVGIESLMKVIKNNQNIIHLDLTQNNISAKGSKKVFKALCSNFSLISLKIGNIENVSKNKVGAKAVPKLNKFIKSSQILSFLDLRSTNLTDAGLVLLTEGLTDNKTIFHLNLCKNDITSSSIEKFAPILFRTAITELDLSQNPLGNNGVRCFSENLYERVDDHRGGWKYGRKCQLLKLNLAETKFQEVGGYHLMQNLIEFKSLLTLVLDYNQFESRNMNSMLNFIKMTRVQIFSINYCRLGDVGGIALGEAISHEGISIKEVRAMYNEFRDATAKAIAQAIEGNAQIEKLDISNNLINDSGGELLGLAIAVNTRLVSFNLRKNNLRATSGAMFAQSMKENKTLKSLKLEANSINTNFLDKIGGFIERNNLHMIENNVHELRQNREGFLTSRNRNWALVKQDQIAYADKIVKLERKVQVRQSKKEQLEEDLDFEMKEYEKAFQVAKNANRTVIDTIDDLSMQLRRVEGQGQKQREEHDYKLSQCDQLVTICKERTQQNKQTLMETKEGFRREQTALEEQIFSQEAKMNAAKREVEDMKKKIEEIMEMSKQNKQQSATKI